MREVAVRARSLICLALMVLSSGCATSPQTPESESRRLRDRLPMTWMAEVSCPGCTEHWLTLTLFADGSYRQRDRYVGSSVAGVDEIFRDIGLWSLTIEGGQAQLVLNGGRRQLLLRLRADGNLQLLDDKGREIRSIREYVLTRQDTPDPLPGTMSLLGLYQPEADGVWFRECQTGQRWLVQDSPGAVEAAQRYAQLDAGEGERRQPQLLSLRGRPSLPGEARPQRLDIDMLDRFWSGATCRPDLMPPAQPLLETNWVLTELRGEPVRAGGISEPPLLKLRSGGRLTGTTGCNRLQATYFRDGNRLTVPRPLITRMTCPSALQRQEQALLSVLRATRDYRVTGNTLELRDGDEVLARLRVSEML
ncbi:MAG: META domain-containing protein [Perlucidibaca sp.]